MNKIIKKISQLVFITNCLKQKLYSKQADLFGSSVLWICEYSLINFYQKTRIQFPFLIQILMDFSLQNNNLIKFTHSMGPCSSRKIQPTQSLHLNNMKTNIQVKYVVTISKRQNNSALQPKQFKQKNMSLGLQYQYNVDVEGVIFDVIAPPDLLEDDNLEPFEGEQ